MKTTCLTNILKMIKEKIILKLLDEYNPNGEMELTAKSEFLDLIEKFPNCFENDCLPGHITGSAIVVDKGFGYVLLNYHAKLERWLGFGGHSDGNPDPIKTAMREAREESGLKSLEFIPGHTGITDIDIHKIPQRGDMPEHFHYDIRIILTADKDEYLNKSHESVDLKWVKIEDAGNYVKEPALLRLINKALNFKEEK